MNQPPHSDEAERGVLSCCIQDPQCIGDSLERIGNEVYFYDLRRERLFRVLVELYHSGKADFLTIQAKLKDDGILDSIGGIVGLSGLQDYAPSTGNLPTYLDELEQKATHRKLINTCGDALEKARKGKLDEVLPEIEKSILEVRPNHRASKDAKSLVLAAIESVERLWVNQGAITGLSTGLDDLDRATDGLHPGELVLVTGYPSTGKTSLSMNIVEHNVLKGIPVGVLSAEMLPDKLMERCVYSTANVNRRDISGGFANEGDFQRIQAAGERLAKSPLHIENASGITIGQAQAIGRRLKQRHDIKLLVMDYLQIFQGTGDSRELEVKSVADGAKRMAMELGIPVILLAQLNDDGQVRESRAPHQIADGHWRLENDGEWLPREQPVKLLIIKGRDSEAGTKVKLLFKKTITKFCNAAKDLD